MQSLRYYELYFNKMHLNVVFNEVLILGFVLISFDIFTVIKEICFYAGMQFYAMYGLLSHKCSYTTIYACFMPEKLYLVVISVYSGYMDIWIYMGFWFFFFLVMPKDFSCLTSDLAHVPLHWMGRILSIGLPGKSLC